MSSAGGSAGFRAVSEQVLHEGFVISLANGTFEAPDGTRFDRDIVHHPGAVAVVPLHDDGTVVLVRQYRAPLDRMMLELPAGKRDVAGEPPEETAGRELVEEVGLRAGELEFLVAFHNSVGFSDEECLVYVGRELTDAPLDHDGIEEEFMEVVRLPLADAVAMIASGEITDAKTVIGLTMVAASSR